MIGTEKGVDEELPIVWGGIVELQSEADRFDSRAELVQACPRERSDAIVLRGQAPIVRRRGLTQSCQSLRRMSGLILRQREFNQQAAGLRILPLKGACEVLDSRFPFPLVELRLAEIKVTIRDLMGRA